MYTFTIHKAKKIYVYANNDVFFSLYIRTTVCKA